MNVYCNICPRQCSAQRDIQVGENSLGYCRVYKDIIHITRYSLHLWEEPCISGTPEMQQDESCPINGSGTIFFSGCNLRCVYCQNYKISNQAVGDKYSVEELADIMIKLQNMGAANINLVTPTHYTQEIVKAVRLAKQKNLNIPIVYNCSGYESTDSLRQLAGIVDVYLTDFKYMNNELAKKYSNAYDYPEIAKTAIDEMYRQQPKLVYDSLGMLQKGVIVRHLLLPGNTKNAQQVLEYLNNRFAQEENEDSQQETNTTTGILISLMNQYTPVNGIEERFPELGRKVTKREYKKMIDFCLDRGMDNVFIQEGDTAKESFIPQF